MTDYQPMSPEELARLTEMFATPIDFDELIAQGVLEKKGAWYVIKDMSRLPEHARRKIKQLKSPNLVQFHKHKKIK